MCMPNSVFLMDSRGVLKDATGIVSTTNVPTMQVALEDVEKDLAQKCV